MLYFRLCDIKHWCRYLIHLRRIGYNLTMMAPLAAILPMFLIVTICDSAKILYVMPFTAKSHYIGMKELALALADRGHDVYVITPYREEVHPATYHQLMVEPVIMWERLFTVIPNIFDVGDYTFAKFEYMLYNSGFLVNELVFNSTDVQHFMKKNHKIDLVISECFFNEALYMFAHKYQSPLVLVTTFGNSFKQNYYSQNPLQLSVSYHEYGVSSDPLSFIGRLRNLYFCTYDLLMLKFWYMPRQLEFAKSYFKDLPEPVPSLEDLAANAAVVLMNSHYSVDPAIAYLPNFIEVGGLHIKNTNDTLPQDLQGIMDNAKSGIVYLSFGSNVRSADLSKDKVAAFLNVFGELKQTVLMKWEDTALANIPKNVILRKWFPQKSVLHHPNVKLFIGHGGLLGLQEAIAAGVPIIGVPVFGDQYVNILQAAKIGHGAILEYQSMTEDSIRSAIKKMLDDDKYLKRARELAVRFRDRPMSAMETAIWWTEYVIRNNGAEFMKSPSLQMSYFAYHMLDVYLFLFVIVLSVAWFVFTLINYNRRLLKGQKLNKKRKRD